MLFCTAVYLQYPGHLHTTKEGERGGLGTEELKVDGEVGKG